MTNYLSPSPYATLDALTPATRQMMIYKIMHDRREDGIELERRARAYQTDIAEADELIFRLVEANANILSLIQETAQRYSRGSVTRVALDNLALEITERIQ